MTRTRGNRWNGSSTGFGGTNKLSDSTGANPMQSLIPTSVGGGTAAHLNVSYLGFALFGFLGACGEAESSAQAAGSQSDSADVQIVENVRDSWQPGEQWRLGPEPLIDIGGIDRTLPEELFEVEGAIRLTNGDIVIANVGTQELRFFDSTGAHRLTVGGKGGGPGKFEYLRWVRRWRGDSVVAYDGWGRRLSFFDRRGRLGRDVTIRTIAGISFFWVLGVFRDGSMLARAPAMWSNDEHPEGISRNPDRLFHIAADGTSFADSVGWTPGEEVFAFRWGGGRYTQWTPYFARETWYEIHDDTYYVAANDTYEIKAYTPTGILQAVIGKYHEHLPITREDIEFVRERVGRLFSWIPGADRRRFDDAMTFAETMPAFGRAGSSQRGVAVDAQANLWVLEYNRPGDERNRWTVFDADGILLGTLSVPDGLEILDIGDDYVLGKWQDDLDVEHVRLYELVKPTM